MSECTRCGAEIPKERLEALPGTRVCVNCSTTQPYLGAMEFGGTKGTASHLVLISPKEKKARDLAGRRYNGKRGFNPG